jgi:hypothetical protein
MDWINVENSLPNEGDSVLVYLGNHIQSRKYDVVTFNKGISKKERQDMREGKIENPTIKTYVGSPSIRWDSKRSSLTNSSDEEGNNQKPYSWQNGPMRYFGQDVTYWMPLPNKPNK